jgi:GMP synthase-like glutamine amidotransferase
MNVLIVKNIPIEGPGTIEDFLREEGIPYRIVEFSKDEIVKSSKDYTHLVVMGGPMAVYEMERHPWLKEEAGLIEDFIKKDKPVLGICLGAQLLAHVLGARVYPGGLKEIGWYKVILTSEGIDDTVMKTLSIDDSDKAEVFQWHGDTFDMPSGAVRLAYSDAYENQAFRYSDKVYALQFHIEVTPEIIKEWFSTQDEPEADEMVAHAERIFNDYLGRAYEFYRNFFLTKNI